MTLSNLLPPLTPAKGVAQSLRDGGFAVISAQDVSEIAHVDLNELLNLTQFWEGLPRDPYLKDGGRYRFRRHSSFEIKGDSLLMVPHRAHWQSVNYNALHGGIERWFEPSQTQLTSNPAWQSLARIGSCTQ